MAKKSTTQAAADTLPLGEPNTPTPLALVEGDEAQLAGLIDELDVSDDGLTEVSAEDIKLPVKVWNFKGVDATGDPIPPNVFYDTVTERWARSIDLMLINLHKTNEWRQYDEAEGRSRVLCRSFDQLKGTMEDGTVRPCQGCPDAQWTTTPEGKRTRHCGPVYNVFAAELESRQPCVLRFKRTSLPAIQSYLNKHHIGRRVQNGKRSNWPLFVFSVRASLRMSDDKKYALPVLEKTGILSKEDIAQGAETVEYVKTVLLGELGKVIEADGADASEGGGDTSFDPDKFAADEGKDFVDGGAD